MPKHTPGPWKADYSPSTGWSVWADPRLHGDMKRGAVMICGDMRAKLEDGANARMIAASPVMLDALHKAFRALCEATSKGGPAFAGEIAAVKDAITQAEGWP